MFVLFIPDASLLSTSRCDTAQRTDLDVISKSLYPFVPLLFATRQNVDEYSHHKTHSQTQLSCRSELDADLPEDPGSRGVVCSMTSSRLGEDSTVNVSGC